MYPTNNNSKIHFIQAGILRAVLGRALKLAMAISIYIALANASFLQGQSMDSLQRILQRLPEDTNKVMIYRKLYRAYYAAGITEPMLEVADKGLALSQRLAFDKGIDLFIFYKASALDMAGRGREAIPLFEQGLLLAERKGDLSVAADYHINLGTTFQGLGNPDQALGHLLAAYAIYEKNGDSESLSRVLNNIGIIYRTQNKLERAEEIYRQSLDIKEKAKDTLGMAASHQNIGLVYSYGANSPEKLELAIKHLSQAQKFYKIAGRPDDIAGCQSAMGQVYFNYQQYEKAKKELLNAEAHFRKAPNIEYSAPNSQLLGMLLAMEGNYRAAEKYFLKGLNIARQTGHKDQIYPLLTELAKTQKASGNFRAASETLSEAIAMQDSITTAKRLNAIAELQTKFDVLQKDNQIKINEIELRERTRQRNWLIIAAILLAILSVVIFFSFRSRIQFNKKIAAQKDALQAQTIRQLEQENKLGQLTAMIEGQEQERNRIANDLHDGLGGLLASVKSHYNAHPPPQEHDHPLYLKTNRLIDDACVEVRRIAHNMMPRTLALSGLKGALEDLATDLKKQGIDCDLEYSAAPLTATQSITTYRIVQELTTNIVKHAQASHVLIQILQNENQVVVLIEDNGIGFRLADAQQKKGLGISSIESRVQFLQGKIEWDAVVGQGTTVVISYDI